MYWKILAGMRELKYGKHNMMTLGLDLTADISRFRDKFERVSAGADQTATHTFRNAERNMLGTTIKDHNLPSLRHSHGTRKSGEPITREYLPFTSENDQTKNFWCLETHPDDGTR